MDIGQPKFFIVLTKLSQGRGIQDQNNFVYRTYVYPQLSLDKTQSIADHQLTLGHHQHQQQSVDCLVTVVNNLFNIYKVS